MFEMTIIYPNGDFDVVQAPERWMLEQQATDMDGLGCMFYIEDITATGSRLHETPGSMDPELWAMYHY